MLTDSPSPSVAPSVSSGPEPLGFQLNDISATDFLIVLAERKRTVLGTALGVTLIALLLCFILPKRYTASVTLMPPQQNSSVGSGALATQIGNLTGMSSLAGSGLGLKNPNEMFVAMLKSRTVEDAMVQRFDLRSEYRKRYMSDARKVFESHISVDGNGKDGLIHIAVSDPDPNRAAELANGYVDQFRDLSEHLAITEASQRRLFFQKQLESAKDNLANAEEEMKLAEQKTGVIQLDSQARALIESAASLRAQIAAKEVQIQSLSTFATSENAQLVRAEQELATLRGQLSRLGGSEESADALIVPRGKVPEAGIEYIRKLRNVKYHETIFDILARQFEMAKLDEARQGAIIQVVDAAIPPDRPSFPKRGLLMFGAVLVGFFLGIGVALAQSALYNLKNDPIWSQKITLLRRAFLSKRHGASNQI